MICDNLSVSKEGHLLFAGQDTVELAKKYTIDESKFVNGILGAYSREISGKSEK